MKTNNVDNNSFSQMEEEEYFDLRSFFYRVWGVWWWFFISVPLCAGIALYIGFSTTPIYEIGAKVMISDSKKGEIGVNPMLKELGLFQGNMLVENEMIELMSKNLIRDVVKELELNINYTRENIMRNEELYKDSPVKILVDLPQNIKDTTFYLVFGEEDKIQICNTSKEVLFEGGYSQIIPMGNYRMTVEKNIGLPKVGDEILVKMQSFESAANSFHKRMEVTLLEKNTSAVQIFLEDVSPERGKDFLYTLIQKYNENGIDDKQLVSAKP